VRVDVEVRAVVSAHERVEWIVLDVEVALDDCAPHFSMNSNARRSNSRLC